MRKGFTLIELLVVVLIIGVLAAIALPQYEKTVEKSRMVEAVVMVRAIADAHLVYYLANGEYATSVDIDKLDITVPCKKSFVDPSRMQTKYFAYAPNGCGSSCTDPTKTSGYLALASRVAQNGTALYNIRINQNEQNRITCGVVSENVSTIQRKLCEDLNANGTL